MTVFFSSSSQSFAYFHLLMTGAIACPMPDVAAAYGFDRCPVCVPLIGPQFAPRRVWKWKSPPNLSEGL